MMQNDFFRAGFGRTDITPDEPVPLAGFGNTSKRFNKVVRDQLYATCVAISDGSDSTVLLFHIDLILLGQTEVDAIRDGITQQLGITQDRIMLCCTHTHSGPDTGNKAEPSILRYNPMMIRQCIKAARLALEDRKEAKLYYGSVEAYHMNFVKHYKHVTADGEVKFFGDNFGKEVLDATTTHATDADPTMHLLKLERRDGKDIIMANWRAHIMSTSAQKRYDLSADASGEFRNFMERDMGCLFAFYQGAAGNINNYSRIREEEITRDPLSFGKVLAQYAKEGLKNMTAARPGVIETKQRVIIGEVDHSMDHLIDKAQELVKLWSETNNFAKVVEAGMPYGFRSPYKATATVRRYNAQKTWDLELNAICLGPDVGIVTAPNELFDTLSVMTEEASSFPSTITMGYCNAYRGYIPSQYGYEYSCYESDATWFAPGIGEQIVENFVEMLNELKKAWVNTQQFL